MSAPRQQDFASALAKVVKQRLREGDVANALAAEIGGPFVVVPGGFGDDARIVPVELHSTIHGPDGCTLWREDPR